MSVETDLYTTLAAASGVSALVSDRIYGNMAPENAAVPFIVYSLSGTDRLHTLPGSGDSARYQLQMECVGNTYAQGKSVASAVIAALQGNGYQQYSYDLYDDITQRHSIFLGWSIIAA